MQIWKTIKFKELEKSKYIRKTDKECNLLAGYKNPNYDVPKGSINITQEVKNNNENFPERRGWRPDSRKKRVHPSLCRNLTQNVQHKFILV